MSTQVGGISIHCVDVAHGRVAAGLRVALYRLDPQGPAWWRKVKSARAGCSRPPALTGSDIRVGGFKVVFDVGDFFRACGTALREPAFLEQVPYRFHIADVAQHCHLPIKFTPWSFSLFRGGA